MGLDAAIQLNLLHWNLLTEFFLTWIIVKFPLLNFIDLSKAFDTLDHITLMHKLSYYGVHGTALTLFQSYLSNRKQYVKFDNVQSDLATLTTGVPQGSILGPCYSSFT